MSQYKTGTARIVPYGSIGTACTAAQGAAGNVDVGLHSWKTTFVHANGGETLPSLVSNVLNVTTSAKQVDLTNIPLGPSGTVSRKVYRRIAGDTGNWKLVGTIANNSATTFTDNIADANLGVDAPLSTTFPTEEVELTAGGVTTANISTGDLFHFKSENIYYTIASITDASKFKLTLQYAGAKMAGLYFEYAVHRDFTPSYNFPELSQRDIDTADIFTRAVREIDSVVVNLQDDVTAISENALASIGRSLTVIVDEFFMGGGAGGESGEIGDLGWFLGAGTSGSGTATEGHPGICNLSSSAVSNTVGRLSQQSAGFFFEDVDELEYIIRPVSGTATMHVRAGITQSSSTAGEAAQGCYFSFNPAVSSGVWRCITRDGSGLTATPTAVSYTLTNWYVLRMKFTADSKVEFYINETLVATHTTNIPWGTAGFIAFMVETNEAVAKTVDIDYFRFKTRSLPQRWT